jgi:hypothetical protein
VSITQELLKQLGLASGLKVLLFLVSCFLVILASDVQASTVFDLDANLGLASLIASNVVYTLQHSDLSWSLKYS